MKDYRYKLEKYKGRQSRYNCPDCGNEHRNTFAKYIDIETGLYLNDKVGRCNRESKCGYHYSPKRFFDDNGQPNTNQLIKIESKPEPLTSHLPIQSINTNYKGNYLYSFLVNQYGTGKVDEVMQLYKIGSSDKWNRSTVFYQFDKFKRCRTGKIMQYDPQTGRRIKKPYNRIAWVHSPINEYNLKQCLFGEHLVRFNDNTPIGIVESEKTALIMAIVKPDIIWLATGGLSNLSKNKVSGLGFRKVVLFPDSGCAAKWKVKVKGLKNIVVSEAIERYPIGYDLADITMQTVENVS